jgi:ABC-2 type transport system permease protein
MGAEFRNVALAVAVRNLKLTFKNPALIVPSVLFPLIFFIAFAGGLSTVGNAPGFDYPAGYTAFQFCFVFLQSAAFGGVFTGFGVAADFESQFTRRLFIAAPRRTGLIAGYALAALGRYAFTSLIITSAALISGMDVGGGAIDLFGLAVLGVLVNLTAVMFGTGLAMRAKTIQVAPLMQMPVFLVLFLAPVYVPLDLLEGWISTLANLNPATAILEAVRGFMAGEPDHSALAFACGVGMVALLSVFAVRGLRRAEAGE